MIKLLINNKEVKFETTKFPDGTSQVWKLEDFEYDRYAEEPVILWLFENEAELVQVLQLNTLVEKETNDSCILRVPYLPYGRQDKDVKNDLTFALHTFKDVLYSAGICRIETFDAHSNTDMVFPLEYATVAGFHESVLKHDIICYPDKGAAQRYGSYGYPVIYCEKVRNQQTGAITGLELNLNGNNDLYMKNILIIDDICDGGMTFIKVAETLRGVNTPIGNIDLAVSHGIFSKGKQVLYDAGINEIFTTNSLLRNPEGFKVW